MCSSSGLGCLSRTGCSEQRLAIRPTITCVKRIYLSSGEDHCYPPWRIGDSNAGPPTFCDCPTPQTCQWPPRNDYRDDRTRPALRSNRATTASRGERRRKRQKGINSRPRQPQPGTIAQGVRLERSGYAQGLQADREISVTHDRTYSTTLASC